MVEGAIKVAELTVADVMVPRAQTVFLPIDAASKRHPAASSSNPATRAFRSMTATSDEILGILLAKDLLKCLARGATVRHPGAAAAGLR